MTDHFPSADELRTERERREREAREAEEAKRREADAKRRAYYASIEASKAACLPIIHEFIERALALGLLPGRLEVPIMDAVLVYPPPPKPRRRFGRMVTPRPSKPYWEHDRGSDWPEGGKWTHLGYTRSPVDEWGSTHYMDPEYLRQGLLAVLEGPG